MCLVWMISTTFLSCLWSTFLCSNVLVFFFFSPSYLVFSSDWLFFLFSNSLLNFSLYSYTLLLSYLVTVGIVTLNSLSGRLLTSTLFSSLSVLPTPSLCSTSSLHWFICTNIALLKSWIYFIIPIPNSLGDMVTYV